MTRTRRRQVTPKYSEICHCLGYFPDHSCCQQYNQCSLITFEKLSFIGQALIGQYKNISTLIGHTGLPVPDFHCHKVLTFCHFLFSAIKRQVLGLLLASWDHVTPVLACDWLLMTSLKFQRTTLSS